MTGASAHPWCMGNRWWRGLVVTMKGTAPIFRALIKVAHPVCHQFLSLVGAPRYLGGAIRGLNHQLDTESDYVEQPLDGLRPQVLLEGPGDGGRPEERINHPIVKEGALTPEAHVLEEGTSQGLLDQAEQIGPRIR